MASKLTKLGFSKLDAIIEEHGDEWLLKNLITRVADGNDPKAIAASIGLPYWVLRAYIEDNCAEDIALALRARADCLEYDATKAVDDADADNVAVARLKSDYGLKLAGKLDRKRYGDKEVAETGTNGLVLPQFLISFVQSVPVIQQHHERVIIEHDVIEHERIVLERD